MIETWILTYALRHDMTTIVRELRDHPAVSTIPDGCWLLYTLQYIVAQCKYEHYEFATRLVDAVGECRGGDRALGDQVKFYLNFLVSRRRVLEAEIAFPTSH